jgi:hypothetical protein
MKIPQSVRNTYRQQKEYYDRLKEEVDSLLMSLKDPRWHYESRIKSEESYALKLETGRARADRFEDFFACTLVVENQAKIEAAKKLVLDHFDLEYRKPKYDDFTFKGSESFPFDDLRLYVVYKDDPTVKPTGLQGMLFEVQIKTFLQHAWSIATHDLTYKADSISWAKARIAYQIKAMLEHAEVSIETAESIASLPGLSKNDQITKKLLETIEMLKEFWASEDLPKEVVRLADNVNSLCWSLKIPLDDLRRMIERETSEGRGTATLNLSPFCIIIQTVVNQSPNSLRTFMRLPRSRFKLLIPREVELPDDFDALPQTHIIQVR